MSETEKKTIIEICKRNDVSYCALFGSFARGEATPDSDIDLMVRFSKSKGFDWLDAAFEIEEVLGRKVDLTTEAGLNRHVAPYVMKDLQVLYGEG
ncbi:MAG: nucleotidyltransferase family protein [Pyrinomonadaceae bacterium]